VEREEEARGGRGRPGDDSAERNAQRRRHLLAAAGGGDGVVCERRAWGFERLGARPAARHFVFCSRPFLPSCTILGRFRRLTSKIGLKGEAPSRNDLGFVRPIRVPARWWGSGSDLIPVSAGG
jgi:hypothetical protein